MPPLGEHDAVWAPILAWARQTGVTCDVTPWAICLDDPTLTAGPQQRLDACLPLLGRPTDLTFEVLNLSRERWLRHSEALRGAAEMFLFAVRLILRLWRAPT
jgi:hypothetical protein